MVLFCMFSFSNFRRGRSCLPPNDFLNVSRHSLKHAGPHLPMTLSVTQKRGRTAQCRGQQGSLAS